MSEKLEIMALWANGEGVPVYATVSTFIFPSSISLRTCSAFRMSMSSSIISLYVSSMTGMLSMLPSSSRR